MTERGEEAPVLVVTGASRGIGRATVEAYLERGFRVATLGRTSEAYQAAQQKWHEQGHTVRHFELDLVNAEETFRVAEQCLSELGPPNVLIHVAGVVERALIHQMAPSVWQSQMEINLHAPFRITHVFLREMLSAGQGRILFVSSISAVLGSAGQAAYNASKAGVLGLMRCLAEEIKDKGLMTAAVLPGAVDTDMLKGSGYAPRMSAREVADTLLFLGTDASPAHNGASIEMFGI